MYDVNPLGPKMHFKQIELEALALRRATTDSRPEVLTSALAWVLKSLQRLR